MSNILYRMAKYEDFKRECETLRQLAFLEVVAHRGAQLSMDDEFYEAIEAQAGLRIIIAYDEDTTEPVGYMVNVIHSSPHDDTRLCATMDLMFVNPVYRRQMVGVKLYNLAEVDLTAFCPQAVWRTAIPVDGNNTNKSRGGLERFGFVPTERVYEKVLGGE